MERSFAEQLVRARKRAGMSQRALAQAAQMNPGYIARLEQGTRSPGSGEVVGRLARALGCTAAEEAELFVAAGLLPPALVRVGMADPDLLLVARLLDPATSPPALRSAVRGIIRSLSPLLEGREEG